jgi:excisionase family DNA binding protein
LYIPGRNFLVRCSEKSRERSVVADYLKLPEVARRLDVSEKTARRMVKSGSLPAVFIGGAYRISEEALAEFLENAKVEPGKAQAPPSPEQPNFNGLLEEERRLSRFSEAIIAAAARWGEAMSSPDMNDTKRFGLIEAALDLSDLIEERAEREDWEALPNQERLEIVTTMGKLTEAAERGISYLHEDLHEAEETKAQEELVDQRREQMREWTRRISA